MVVKLTYDDMVDMQVCGVLFVAIKSHGSPNTKGTA